MLILTNDTELNNKLLNPQFKHERTYYVQVDGNIDNKALLLLNKGVQINLKGKLYKTMPVKAVRISEPEELPERIPPIRFRKNVPTSWVKIALTEGKNRQVRKMTAAAGYPTLRLIRISIEDLSLPEFIAGKIYEINGNEIKRKLRIE